MTTDNTIDELTDANFDSSVLQCERPKVVLFWAPWSGPSQQSAAAFKAVAADYDDTVAAARINVDDHPETAANYSVITLPSFVLFDDHKIAGRVVGSASSNVLRQLFDRRR